MHAPTLAVYQRFGRRIRRRIIWTFLAFGLGAGATWWFREDIFRFLLAPAGDSLSPFEGGLPVFTAPTDMMGSTINLSIKGGAVAALPVFWFSVYTLVRPILLPEQRRFLAIFLFSTVACFAGGAAFAYYVMLPNGLGFLLHFGDGISIPLITLSEYIALFTAMMFWLGVVFELPLVMYLLAKTRIVSYQRMKWFQKFVPVAAGILAAIVTPTFDPVNFLFMWGPIVVLYQVGLFLAWAAHPEKGNYMFVKTFWSLLTSPYRGARWVWGKVTP